MKHLYLCGLAAISSLFAISPASSQEEAGINIYGTLGYARDEDADIGLAQARLGARLGAYFGVEGEVGTGVESRTVTFQTVPPLAIKSSVSHEAAVYGVGYLPLAENADLFARVGYGTTKAKVSSQGVSGHRSEESWNYGAGAQYYFDGKNGIRAEYLRKDYESPLPATDNWSIAYTRRF